MIIKEYRENVLEKTSTHIKIRKYDAEQDIIIADLVARDGDNEEVLATDRYYNADYFNLTEEELNEIS